MELVFSSSSSSLPSPSGFCGWILVRKKMGKKESGTGVAQEKQLKKPAQVKGGDQVEKPKLKTGKEEKQKKSLPAPSTKQQGPAAHVIKEQDRTLDKVFRTGMTRFMADVVDQPHLFLLVNEHPQLSTLARTVTKNLHDLSSARPAGVLNGRLSFGPLKELLVDGFDTEQVWEEIQLRNGPFMKSVTGLLKDPKVRDVLLSLDCREKRGTQLAHSHPYRCSRRKYPQQRPPRMSRPWIRMRTKAGMVRMAWMMSTGFSSSPAFVFA